MGANFSKIETVVSGETITASERNAEFDNILNNFTPSGMDDYSVNTTQMQATSDPYPGAVESLATSLAGELERIRFVIKQITGKAQWYIDPTNDSFAAGTALVFYQASAPTGWTAVSVNDKFLRVVTAGGTGGTTGGTVAASTSLAHTHTMSHTHTIAHRHATPFIQDNGSGLVDHMPNTSGDWGEGDSAVTLTTVGISRGSTGSISGVALKTKDTDTADSGAASVSTTSSALGAFAYADVVAATKD